MQIIPIPKNILITIFRFENVQNNISFTYWKSVLLYDRHDDLYYIKYGNTNDDCLYVYTRIVTKSSLNLIYNHIRKQKLKILLKCD